MAALAFVLSTAACVGEARVGAGTVQLDLAGGLASSEPRPSGWLAGGVARVWLVGWGSPGLPNFCCSSGRNVLKALWHCMISLQVFSSTTGPLSNMAVGDYEELLQYYELYETIGAGMFLASRSVNSLLFSHLKFLLPIARAAACVQYR